MYFLNADGNPIINSLPNDFSKNFDWVLTRTQLYKFKYIPETIYVKTDFLRYFANILPTLTNKFILITLCSDYSPSVKFRKEYNIIVEHPLLLLWYASNKVHEHEKIKPFPQGLCNYPEEIHNLLLKLNK